MRIPEEDQLAVVLVREAVRKKGVRQARIALRSAATGASIAWRQRVQRQ